MNYLKELIFKRGGNGHHARRTSFIFNCIFIFLVFCISMALIGCGGDSSDDGNGATHTHICGEWRVTSETYPATSTRICLDDATHNGTRITQIGDTGPGGGKIFYIADGDEGRPLGFTLYMDAGDTIGQKVYYLEAAPTDINTNLAWASSGFVGTSIGNTSQNIGTGSECDKNSAYAQSFSYNSNNSLGDGEQYGQFKGNLDSVRAIRAF